MKGERTFSVAALLEERLTSPHKTRPPTFPPVSQPLFYVLRLLYVALCVSCGYFKVLYKYSEELSSSKVV